jgi:hypothetical protein
MSCKFALFQVVVVVKYSFSYVTQEISNHSKAFRNYWVGGGRCTIYPISGVDLASSARRGAGFPPKKFL